MNEEILKLEPSVVWKNFRSLLNIPRASGNEKQIINFIKEFGEKLGLKTIVDEVGNVIIKKPATPGMEKFTGVILQGHLDMVPQKNSDSTHNFDTDSIQSWIDGDWVKAKGTTLGSDNGIGVAAAMSVLELNSTEIQHPAIEALFTIDEERGMTGAFGLKAGLLDGKILINMDSEDEGELYVGCAGGVNGNFKFTYKEMNVPKDYTTFKITIKGLKGGHSGLDINLGRGNSNKILFRFLKHACSRGALVCQLEGGNMRNAIPREATAVIAFPNMFVEKFKECVAAYEQTIMSEYKLVEPNFSFKAEEIERQETAIDLDTLYRLVNAVLACPDGVMRMSNAMPGLVETSTNLSIVKSEKDYIKVQCLLRSSVDSSRQALCEMMSAIFELGGAEVEFTGDYPGWNPNMDSKILKVMQDVYKNKFEKIPEIKAVHAGLECGLFNKIYTGLDIISFGPTIRHPHSPDEKVCISTVEKFWVFLKESLKNINW